MQSALQLLSPQLINLQNYLGLSRRGCYLVEQIDSALDMDIRLSVTRRNWWVKDIIRIFNSWNGDCAGCLD